MAATAPPLPDRPRAVLDTSVLMSGERHWLWAWARLNRFQGIWNTQIVAELVRIRVETAIKHGARGRTYGPRINTLIRLLARVLVLVDAPDQPVPTLVDLIDAPIPATAIAARADCVVTFNVRDFPADGAVAGIRILTPEQLRSHLDAVAAREGFDPTHADPSARLP